MLSNDVRDNIRAAVALGGKVLVPKLAPNSSHTTRNSYAHLWGEIKQKMGKSYLECDDSDEEAILEIIRHSVNDSN